MIVKLQNLCLKFLVLVLFFLGGVVVSNFLSLNLVYAMYFGEQMHFKDHIAKLELEKNSKIKPKYCASGYRDYYEYINDDLLKELFELNCFSRKYDIAFSHAYKFWKLIIDTAKDIENELQYSGPPRVLDYLKENGIQLDNLKKNELKDLELKKIERLLKEMVLQKKGISVNKFFSSVKIQKGLECLVLELNYVFNYVEECCDLLKKIKTYLIIKTNEFDVSSIYGKIKDDFENQIRNLIVFCFENDYGFARNLFERFDRKKGFCNLVDDRQIFGGLRVNVGRFYLKELRDNFERMKKKCVELEMKNFFDDSSIGYYWNKFFKFRLDYDTCAGFKWVPCDFVDYDAWLDYIYEKYGDIEDLLQIEKNIVQSSGLNIERIESDMTNLKIILEGLRKQKLDKQEYIIKQKNDRKDQNIYSKYESCGKHIMRRESTYLDDENFDSDGNVKFDFYYDVFD